MNIKKISKRASKIILGILICVVLVIGGYCLFEYSKPIQQKEIDADVVAFEYMYPKSYHPKVFFTQDQKEIQDIHSILSSGYKNNGSCSYHWDVNFYNNGKKIKSFAINEGCTKYNSRFKKYLSKAKESNQKASDLNSLLSELLPYKLVYSKFGFEVRETLIDDSEWAKDLQLNDMYEWHIKRRINNTEKNYVSDDSQCLEGSYQKINFEIKDSSGKNNEFSFEQQKKQDEISIISKNKKEIWKGEIGSMCGYCPAIKSIIQINDGIAVDYYDNRYNYNCWNVESNQDSVLLIDDQGVRDISRETKYDQAFSPHSIRGELAYIGRQNDQLWLIYDDEKTVYYEEILADFDNDDCYPSIFSDGNIIDFFARKNGKVYHVQAGYFDGKTQQE